VSKNAKRKRNREWFAAIACGEEPFTSEWHRLFLSKVQSSILKDTPWPAWLANRLFDKTLVIYSDAIPEEDAF
jgi:hypothetical protein